MAEIRTPVEGFTGQVVGVNFVDGVGHTDNAAALAYFRRHNYGVSEDAKAHEDGPKPVEKMTKAELVEHAESIGADISEAKTKDDILAAIAANEAPSQDD